MFASLPLVAPPSKVDAVGHDFWLPVLSSNQKTVNTQNKMTPPPPWLTNATATAPAGAHYKITIRSGWQEHDGYCSDADELHVPSWTERVVYLAADKYTLENIRLEEQWSEPTGKQNYHYGCGAEYVAEVARAERVD